MAIGDAADAAEMDTLAGTEDLRDTYIEHNRTRDYLANHQMSGTHDAAAITAGTLDLARIPVLPASKSPDATRLIDGPLTLAPDGDRFTASGSFLVTGGLGVNGYVSLAAAYNQSVAGHGGWRDLYVAADGLVGGLTSASRYKQDIRLAEIPRATLRAIRVCFYRYIADVEAGHDLLNLGAIADEIHELGLTFLVNYNADGEPEGLNDRMIAYLGILLAQDAEDRLDMLTRAVDDLEAKMHRDGGAA